MLLTGPHPHHTGKVHRHNGGDVGDAESAVRNGVAPGQVGVEFVKKLP